MIMWIEKTVKIGIILILVFPFTNSLIGQEISSHDRFSHFSVSLDGNMYMKGDYQNTKGDYVIKSRNMYSGQVGLNYHVLDLTNKWNIVTGLIVGLPPAYSLVATIKQEDLYTTSDQDAIISNVVYSHYALNIPIMLEYKRSAGQKHTFSADAGLRFMFLGSGSASLSYIIVDDVKEREVFNISVGNDNPQGYANAVFGFGDYISTKFGLIRIGIRYNKSFTTVFEGEYSFQELAQSADTRGTYKLSGDYISLGVSYSWNNSNNRK